MSNGGSPFLIRNVIGVGCVSASDLSARYTFAPSGSLTTMTVTSSLGGVTVFGASTSGGCVAGSVVVVDFFDDNPSHPPTPASANTAAPTAMSGARLRGTLVGGNVTSAA